MKYHILSFWDSLYFLAYIVWLHFGFYPQSLIAVAMVVSGTIDSLIDFFSFTAWIFYGGSMLALIVMRYTKPNAPRPYKVMHIILICYVLRSNYLV
jgi:L-type amino acid transporter 9